MIDSASNTQTNASYIASLIRLLKKVDFYFAKQVTIVLPKSNKNNFNDIDVDMEDIAWMLRTFVPVSTYAFLPTTRIKEINDKAVVLIGVDTGIGHATVLELAKLNFRRIYAGCLTKEGRESFAHLKNVEPFYIDVLKEEVVREAFDAIGKKEQGMIYAVVHVAGLMAGGPLEFTNEDVFRYEMNINYFGLLKVIKHSMPLLRAFGTRHQLLQEARFIVVTSTIAIMPSFPGFGGYCASKHAAVST